MQTFLAKKLAEHLDRYDVKLLDCTLLIKPGAGIGRGVLQLWRLTANFRHRAMTLATSQDAGSSHAH